MSVPVYIAVYRPVGGEAYHWSLYLKGTSDHIYEVTGEPFKFKFNHVKAKPGSSIRHKEDILVGYVSQKDLPKLHTILRSVDIDNENPGWCCQDWVLEALEVLCFEFYFDEEDEDYKRGVRRAKRKYFGPM